jgi:hypothetical protein
MQLFPIFPTGVYNNDATPKKHEKKHVKSRMIVEIAARERFFSSVKNQNIAPPVGQDEKSAPKPKCIGLELPVNTTDGHFYQ